jgi:hypothetical protein
MTKPVLLRTLFLTPLLLCAINVIAVCASGGYDVTVGPLHLGSHSPFKAIVQMEGAFLLALVALGAALGGGSPTPVSSEAARRGFNLWLTLLICLICAAYAPSLAVNFQHQDWNHRLVSAGIRSWQDAGNLFTKPQIDGFYRPLTFLSLWADYRVFGDRGWGYHLQSIAFHIVNCILLLVLARTLGFPERVARWAAVLFAVAAVNFEPLLWPAARFDLIATAFTLLAFTFALRYLNGAPARTAVFSAIALALGILNKESAYCFPLVMGCLVFLIRPLPVRKALNLAAATLFTICLLLFVRLAVLRGFGGYAITEKNPHFKFTVKTLTSLFTRLPVGLLGINTAAVNLPGWWISTTAVFAVVLVAAVMAGARASRRDMVVLLCALASAIPTLNIIIWINESMQQARYLYMPGVWLALFAASVLSRCARGWAVALLALWATVNLAGLEYNLGVYQSTLAKTQIISERVREDFSQTPGARTILIQDLAEQPNGVFFGGSELISRIQSALPDAVIVRHDGESADGGCPDLWYRWNPSTADLVREAQPASCRGLAMLRW